MRFPPRTLTTARLRFRPPTLEDAPVVFEAYARDPDVTRYVGWQPHTRLEETQLYIRQALVAWREGKGHRSWVLELHDSGALVGMIGTTREGFMVSVGYVLARPYWNLGLATEALRAVCQAALADPGIWRVWAWADVENAASARVMEKAGMQFEGVLRRFSLHPGRSPEPRDCRCYAMTR